MITSFFTKGIFFLAFCLTLISIPPSVSIYETQMENCKLEQMIKEREIEFEVNAKRVKKATYSEGISNVY